MIPFIDHLKLNQFLLIHAYSTIKH